MIAKVRRAQSNDYNPWEQKQGKIRFLGAKQWDAYNGDATSKTSDTNASNVPGASALLDYRSSVKELQFSLGTSGATGPWPGASNRFFSIAMGNAYTKGGGENQGATSETVDAVIEVGECFDFYITASAACIEDEEAASAAGVAAQSDDLFNEEEVGEAQEA
mgnify:CR=1 FL=1